MRACSFVLVLLPSLLLSSPVTTLGSEPGSEQMFSDRLGAVVIELEKELVAIHGPAIQPRLSSGLAQVAALWRSEDGDTESFADFVRSNFAFDPSTYDQMFSRMQINFEQIDGLSLEITRELRMYVDLDRGPLLPFDEAFAAYNPSAHFSDDFFANRLAFMVLLNFAQQSLEEKVAKGETWSRRRWAEVRLAERFDSRVPAEVKQAITEAGSKANSYIAEYNIWMHHLLDSEGRRLFKPGLRLVSHWNLRDELKSVYGEADGPAKQEMICQVMERIVTQTIPQAVIDNPRVDWNPFTNEVKRSPAVDHDLEAYPEPATEVSNRSEPCTRYQMILDLFHAVRAADPYHPTNPTLIDRVFNKGREIPEHRVREILETLMTSPVIGQVAGLIEQRLGRPLQPYDIWYNGFRSSGSGPGSNEAELDRIVAQKYPTAEAFEQDIPRILRKLDFPTEQVTAIAAAIAVHASRGIGHASGAARRGDLAYLRTRVGPNGMSYKAYNIATHELGHNVEQVLSLNNIDHTLLEGVPNTAFTEALAFVFQEHDLHLLGLATPSGEADAMEVFDELWNAYEISGVALVEMDLWHYLYEHPDATPAELRDAVVGISRQVWNRYFAPVFGVEDVALLAVYSHMVYRTLYIPDYALGHLIGFQIKQRMHAAGAVGPEFVRMAQIGDVTPDLWMKRATGRTVGAEALLEGARKALESGFAGSN